MILLDMQGADFSALMSLIWENGAMVIGIGFVLAAIGVLKVMNLSPENSKKKIITFFVGLLVFFVIAGLLNHL